MDTTLTAARTTRQTGSGILESVTATLNRMRTAIVNGPSGACWRPAETTTSFSMLPSSERGRLLDAGLAPTSR